MKRILTICICLLLCVTISGCGWIDSIKETFNNKQSANLSAEIATNTVSESTRRASEAAQKGAKLAAEATADFQNSFSIPLIPKSWLHPIKYGKMKAAKSTSAKLQANLKSVAANDAVFLKSKQDKKDKNFKEKVLPILLIILGVIALIVFAIIMLKRKPKITAQVSSEQPAPQRASLDVDYYQIDYDTKLHEVCDRLGKNYEDTLNEYGGDVMKAYNALYLK